ncbi:MAG: (d)CMP kinase, partial [Actinobacteria bacterium]|nr:(d)CMP kinase [Actinomycetota bacterium]
LVSNGWTYLDTGAIYRAVTLLALEQGIPPGNGDDLGQLARNAEIGFQPGPGGAPRVFAGCREVTAEIRSLEVTGNVSEVSAQRQVREALLKMQRQCAAGGNVVVDGRDIGTVVFPEAEVKIFLTASVGERAKRRRLELDGKGVHVAQAQMEKDIAARDDYDSSREVAPLKAAIDAVMVDTTDLSIEQVVDRVVEIIDQKSVV